MDFIKRFFFAVAAVCCLSACSKPEGEAQIASETPPPPTVSSPSPAPEASAPAETPVTLTTPPPPRLAPEGTFFLVEYVSITTDSGIHGFAPGTELRFVAEHENGTKVRTLEGMEIIVPASKMTNNLDLASQIAAIDAQAQLNRQPRPAATPQFQTPPPVQATPIPTPQAKRPATVFTTPQPRSSPSATPYSNPLGRGGYDEKKNVSKPAVQYDEFGRRTR